MSELVAITDLHLGDRDKENGSVLTSPKVRQIFANVLGEVVGWTIDTLVITGDLFEVCVPSRTVKQDFLHETTCFGLYNSTVEDAGAFFVELGKVIDIDKLVWVPGNHDFTLHRRICGSGNLIRPRKLRENGEWLEDAELARLFGSDIPNIVTAFPNYVHECEAGWPLAIFTHGHLYDKQVLRPDASFLKALGIALETGHRWDPIPENIGTDGGSWTKKLVELTNHRVSDIWPQNLSLVAEAVYDYVLRRNTRVMCLHRPEVPGQRFVPSVFGQLDVGSSIRGHLGWYLDNVLVDIAPVVPLGYRDTPREKLPHSVFVCGHTHDPGCWQHLSLDELPFDIHDVGGWTMDAAKNHDNVPHTHALVWDRFPGTPNHYALNVGKP